MARIKAAIVVTIAALMPLSAGALGLGEIDLKSALNQPFSAEIPVASEAPGDIDGLSVEIATAETFEQFGLDRAPFLSDFQFSVVSRANGAAVQISSQSPVVEPFVTLLLKVSWAQGRLLREYTVLLDPPVFATESIEPAVAAPTAAPSDSAPLPRAEKLPEKSMGEKPLPAEPQIAAPVSTQRTQFLASADGDTYGPVERNDTLWAIAGRLAEESTVVNRNQMMLAIYQANPEAFTGNINRLKAGMILRIPAASEFTLGSSEATAEVRRQNEEWRSASAGRGEQQGGRLRLVPPPERDAEAAEPGAQAGVGDESAAALRADRDSLEGRVSELENQLDESRRQLEVRDQELAALQSQLAGIAAGEPEAEPVVEEPEPAPETAAPVADTEEQAGPADDIEAPAPADSVAAPEPMDVTPAQVEGDDESFLGALFTSPLVYISLAIVLLLAWLFARNRSKTSEESVTGHWEALDAVDEDLPEEVHEATTRLEAHPPQDDTFVVEESPGEATGEGSIDSFAEESPEEWGGLAEEGETPLERTISTDSAVNLDQADPIAESDFHMAYGLYDQAAELLTRAVESEPERKDLRLKLLEVYFIWENQDGFMKEAAALQELIDGAADPDWNKVLIMGKQICPDENIFAGDAAPAGMTDSVDLEFGEDGGADVIDISLDGDDQSADDLQFGEEDADLDLDLTGADLGAGDQGDDDSAELDFTIADDEMEMSGDAPTMETPTVESPEIGGERTIETPTVESPEIDGERTMETPTVESPLIDGEGTMETPTIESPAIDTTMETPTVETPTGQWDDDSVAGREETAEINLDDLDLDLAGLDDIGADALGEDETESDAAGAGTDFAADTLEFDAPGDETEVKPTVSLDDIIDDAEADVESTAEMLGLDDEPQGGDTVEQPGVGAGDTAEQPNLAGAEADEDSALDIGEPLVDDDPTAALEDAGSGVEGATMTEVGTKLDLARAYIDMGDPDGARSILNEVLEEADGDQRQEAQKLLDDLAD